MVPFSYIHLQTHKYTHTHTQLCMHACTHTHSCTYHDVLFFFWSGFCIFCLPSQTETSKYQYPVHSWVIWHCSVTHWDYVLQTQLFMYIIITYSKFSVHSTHIFQFSVHSSHILFNFLSISAHSGNFLLCLLQNQTLIRWNTINHFQGCPYRTNAKEFRVLPLPVPELIFSS